MEILTYDQLLAISERVLSVFTEKKELGEPVTSNVPELDEIPF